MVLLSDAHGRTGAIGVLLGRHGEQVHVRVSRDVGPDVTLRYSAHHGRLVGFAGTTDTTWLASVRRIGGAL